MWFFFGFKVSKQFELIVFLMLCKKVACFGFWKKEHIDLLIKRGLLDVGALVARDGIGEDVMSKFEKTRRKKCVS